MITQKRPKVNKQRAKAEGKNDRRKIKETKNRFFDKNVNNFPVDFPLTCGKLCGNCGKHSKIAVFAKNQTNVPVENFLHLITSLIFLLSQKEPKFVE